MTFNTDTIKTAAQSATAIVCDNAALFGATPERDEFDAREIWDEDVCAVNEAFCILSQGVAPDGTQMADEREHLLWGFVNMLHAQAQRLDRSVDKLTPELQDLQRTQDGSEIRSLELELTAPGTSPTAATPSRPCATRPPKPTEQTPATHGGPGAAARPDI